MAMIVATAKVVLPPLNSPPFDPNILMKVPTTLPKINETKLEMREAISAMENLLQEENENEKNAMSDKLNALFP